jgi:hypothetical protein
MGLIQTDNYLGTLSQQVYLFGRVSHKAYVG